MVLMHTGFGGTRMIDMLVGDPLPRGFVREIEAAGFVIGMRSAWCAIRTGINQLLPPPLLAGLTSSRLDVQRALYSLAAAVEDVGVDHGRLHVFVAQKLLDGPDVVAAFQ